MLNFKESPNQMITEVFIGKNLTRFYTTVYSMIQIVPPH